LDAAVGCEEEAGEDCGVRCWEMVVERWQGLFLGSEWLLWKTRLCLHWRLGVFFSFDTLQSCVVSNDCSQSALCTLNHDVIT
jgi:hypothetical protein